MWPEDPDWQMTASFLMALAVTGLSMKMVAQFLPANGSLDRRGMPWLLLSPTSHGRLRAIVNVRMMLVRPALLCGAFLVSFCVYDQMSYIVGTRSIFLNYCAAPILLLLSETLLALVSLPWVPSGQVLPPIHDRPWLARSVADFWGHRWNLWFSDWFRYAIFNRLRRRPVFVVVLVFAVSGVVHEWVINVPLYLVTGRALFGTMMLYFLIQAVGVLVERRFRHYPILPRIFAWFVVILPVPLILNEGLLRTMHLWRESLVGSEVSGRPMGCDGAVVVRLRVRSMSTPAARRSLPFAPAGVNQTSATWPLAMTTFHECFYPIFGAGLVMATIASIGAGMMRGLVIPALLLNVGVFSLWAGLFLGSEIGYQKLQALPDPPAEAFADTFPMGALIAGWLPAGVFCAIVFGIAR